MNDVYLEEYRSDESIRRYTSKSAGHGISYLLKHDYADVYLKAIDQMLQVPKDTPLRILEFGCGGGMNLITLVSLLERKGRTVETAVGADFSEVLIKAANAESKSLLRPEQQKKMLFAVARNEQLVEDLAKAGGRAKSGLENHFHVIVGVNTFRYCHRLGKQNECARDIAYLLAPGGTCVNIDMNRRFPAFRSQLPYRSDTPGPEIQTYLPTLDEYTTPFSAAGLEVLKSETFCWIPHSAGPGLLMLCRVLTPFLNVLAKPMAMRSLVISRKKK